MKIPDPIIDPATIIVESSSPSPRMNPVCLSSVTWTTSAIEFLRLLGIYEAWSSVSDIGLLILRHMK
jgi:hypothetical protein